MSAMKKQIGALLIAGVVAGCTGIDNRSFSGLETIQAEARFGSVLHLTQFCPSETESTGKRAIGIGVLGTLASAGAQFAVDAVEESISSYKEGLSGFFVASTSIAAVELSGAGCLIVARGLIGPVAEGVAERDGGLESGELAALGLADFPAFYLEYRLVPSSTGFYLEPTYLSYAASSARSRGSGKKYVSVAVALSDAALKKGTDLDSTLTEDNAFAVTHHDFGRLAIGNRYGAAQLVGTRSHARLDARATNAAGDLAITAVVTESENAGIALKALESAFKGNKDALKSELEKLVKEAVGVDVD